MEKKHLPSSPLQHHRPSSSHPSKPPAPESNKSDKLSVPRPNNPGASPAAPTASINPWPQQERQIDERWRTQPSGWNAEGPNTQPIASSSRCPTPLPPLYLSSSPPRHPSNGLLTSEPLNRSASQHSPMIPPPVHVSTADRVVRKRSRATSLPASTPIFKRRKSRHYNTTPSDPWPRSIEPRSIQPSRYEVQQERAAVLGKELLAGRTLRSPPGARGEQIVVATKQPPINVASLRSLDAGEILKNPQLRHDLLFDSLAFRPINSCVPFPSSSADPGSPSTVEPRTSSIVADMYWDSIAAEIIMGCRCARWRVVGGEGRVDMGLLDKRERVKSCLCGKWRPDLTEDEWWRWQASPRWQSRLPELIITLREIMISLMGSTTPCTSHFAHSFSKESLDAHELSCPTVTHALVPALYTALDPEFLTIQARRGVFGLDLFRMMGEAMKVHCAPVRDAMVDDMVRTAMSGNVSAGLKKCFDCVEVMKLDICNHQVHALRPYLWGSASQCELSAFHSLLAHGTPTLDLSVTRKWLRSASKRVIESAHPAERNRLVTNRSELVVRSIAEGFVDLVFSDWSKGSRAWPPVVQRRVAGPGGVQLVEASFQGSVDVPESLKMDSRRIKDFQFFSAEANDTTISFMILLAIRDLIHKTHGSVSTSRLSLASTELGLASADPGWLSNIAPSPTSISDIACRLAIRIIRPDCVDFGVMWHKSQDDVSRLTKTARTIDRFIMTNVNRQSSLFMSSFKRVRNAVTQMLSDVLLAQRLDPTSMQYDPRHDFGARDEGSSPARARERHAAALYDFKDDEQRMLRSTGLQVVEADLTGLVRRMERIVGFHAGVFAALYEGRGMMVGS